MDDAFAFGGNVSGENEHQPAKRVDFVIPPTVRYAGQPGEQATMFLLDPAGNALEFKALADPAKLFARD